MTEKIQDIAVSHNCLKKLAKCIKGDKVLYKDEEGEIVVNIAAYNDYKNSNETTPIEDIIGTERLDFSADYIVFS